jgi:hypothetical protein
MPRQNKGDCDPSGSLCAHPPKKQGGVDPILAGRATKKPNKQGGVPDSYAGLDVNWGGSRFQPNETAGIKGK